MLLLVYMVCSSWKSPPPGFFDSFFRSLVAYTTRVRVRCSFASYHHLDFKVPWEFTATRSGMLLEWSI